MAKCSNCGSNLTCGCQKRKLPDGTQGCANCIGKVNNLTKTSISTTEEKSTVSVNVLGKDRYKNI